MILEQIFDSITKTSFGTDDIDEIVRKISVDNINEIIDIPDLEIDKFLDSKSLSEEDTDKHLKIFEKIKQERMLEKLAYDASKNKEEEKLSQVQELFEMIEPPDDICISGNELIIKYNISEGSKLDIKINEKEKWTSARVIETVSEKYGVPSDNIVFVETLKDYISNVSDLADSNYVSRGQKDCSFDFKSSLHRIYHNGSRVDMNDYESLFKQRLLYYDESVERKSDEEIRAYGQHFGLPTNYLDFTEAHLISLLFAVEEYEYLDNHAIVFFVDAFSHNKEAVKQETKLINYSDTETKATIERQYGDKSYFIRVGNCNERLHFQKGCFLKVETTDSLANMFRNHTKIIIIDKNRKKEILKELFKLGITFENIYPDKDNMVKTIRFMKENM